MLGLLLLFLWASERQTHACHDSEPYLLIGADRYVYKLNADGSGLEHLVYNFDGGIFSVDYHFRFNYLFWTNTKYGTVNRAWLSNGEGQTVIASHNLSYPAGLAVDWIRDKLYWTDRDLHKMEEYDIIHETRRTLFETMNSPWGLALDPYDGWIYWADRSSQTVERINVMSMTDRAQIHTTHIPCTLNLAIDYDSLGLYWTDYCMYRIETSGMDGAERSVMANGVYFSGGIAVFNHTVYWTQRTPTAVISMEPHGAQRRKLLFRDPSQSKLLHNVKVVYPHRRLTADS